MTFPIYSERLRIQPLSLVDVDAFVAYRQDPAVARFQSWDSDYSREQGLLLVESQAGIELPSQGEWLQLALHDLLSGELIGDLALHALAEDKSAFEIGFTIAPKHQRKGYAAEGLERLMQHLFRRVGASLLIAHTDSRNTAAIRLLLSLGFNQRHEKSWSEDFKNESVVVEYFEVTHSK